MCVREGWVFCGTSEGKLLAGCSGLPGPQSFSIRGLEWPAGYQRRWVPRVEQGSCLHIHGSVPNLSSDP